jgi:polyprenyl-phospho-N-acetylgalactosaminyl synthase
MVLLHPKEVPLCLTGTVSRICWRFCTGTLRRRLTRSHSIVGALSMAICQWDSKSTVWATGASSLLWWKALEERKKFSMPTTINTPTPRSALCCPRVVTEVKRAGHAVVVVDDGSSDATADQARAGGAVVIRHPFNLGQGAALQTGIDYALAHAAEFIVTFDADGQHRLSDISRLVEALVQERADFALGSRFLGQAPNLPPLRRLVLRAATAFTRLTTGLQMTDTHNGLRAMTRRGAAAIRLQQNRMAHASEWLSQIAASGLRYVERPVTIEYTAYSLAKGQTIADAVLILLDLFARRLYR